MMRNYKFLIVLTLLLSPFAFFILNNSKDSLSKKYVAPNIKRKISSLPPKIYQLPDTPKKEKQIPKIFGRKILGNKKIAKNVKPINKYNPNWKNILEKYLLKFQNSQVGVNIKLNEALYMVKNNQGRFVEEVTINYSEKGEPVSSFRAYVDSESGEILSTFDKTTIQERRKPYPRLRPTGSIKNPPARRTKEKD